ncbi:hypothetical protein GGF43_005325, partial [Coemansia sp. RSA 2618]
ARAHTLHKLGECTRAMDDAKEAVAIDGGSAGGYMRMAAILAATGRPRDALGVLGRGLRAVGEGGPGFAQMDVQRMSVERLLDPAYAPRADARRDPLWRLPGDVAVLVLRLLDTRMLAVCRAVSRRWAALIDAAPVLWSRPRFARAAGGVQELAAQLPAYAKARRLQARQGAGVPEHVLRRVFERARGSLAALCFPDGAVVAAATVDALLAHRRPCLRSIDVARTAAISEALVNRVLNWGLSPQIAAIRVPYRSHIGDAAMEVIARGVPALRVLDISGCTKVRVKHLYKAWNAVLADAHGATRLEELYMNDHPGIPELLVYGTKYRHFSGLKVLHIAIRDQGVLSMCAGLAPLMNYLQRIPNAQIPFPALAELCIDGLWDATIAARRFESVSTALVVSRSRLLCSGLRRLSALDAAFVGAAPLYEALAPCFATLRRLHLTRAASLDSAMVWALLGTRQLLPLASLDLSGCVAVDAQALAALVGRCASLVHVNLAQTAADNAVLAELTRIAGADAAAGLEVVVLDTTDVSGAAVRDFAAACAKRYCRMRGDAHARRAWRLRLLDVDNCANVGCDAVAIVRDLLSFMQTRILAAVPG